VLAVEAPLDDAALFQLLQAVAQQIGGDTRRRVWNSAKRGAAEEQLTHDEQCPAVAEQSSDNATGQLCP